MSTQTTTCSHCGAAAPADAAYCPDCGSPLAEVRTFGSPPTIPIGRLGRRLSALRIRSRAVVESLSAQSVARREVTALYHELERLRAERESMLRELGLAVYDGDEQGTERGRVAIGDLDREIAAKEERMAGITLQAQAHVAQVRAESQPTMLLEPDGAAPAPVPEPYPPPDEGTPPTPTPVPEPYPPPDEGDPPQPD